MTARELEASLSEIIQGHPACGDVDVTVQTSRGVGELLRAELILSLTGSSHVRICGSAFDDDDDDDRDDDWDDLDGREDPV